MTKYRLSNLLDSLDQKDDWQFLLCLYVIRWLILIPIMIIGHFVFSDAQKSLTGISHIPEFNLSYLFVLLVILSPLYETLLECSLPYLIMSRLRRFKGKQMPIHSWGFIVVSALLMALSHPMRAAIFPALITGTILAYCYNHFALRSNWRAIATTTAFHGAINIVGWSMIVFKNLA